MFSKRSSSCSNALSDLTRVRQWASEKIQGGSEPPWAWFQYMKLIESVDAILAGMAVTTTESSQQSVEHRGKLIQLVVASDPQDSAQPHPDTATIPLPM
jgi:hypothetical protein